MKTITRTLPLLLLMIFGLAGHVSAQTSWLPSHSASQHVYVAPGVDNSLATQFNSADFSAQLTQVSSAQNLDVYVIVTATGSDVSNNGSPGPLLVRKVWDNWTSTSGFKRDRALVILLTGDGRSLISVGARAGDALNRLGIVRDTMSSPTGPVRTTLSNLASNPSVVPIRIVENVNAIIAAKLAAQAPSSSASGSSTTAKSGGSGFPWLVVILVGGGIVLAVVMISAARSSNNPPSSYNRTTTTGGFQQRMNDARRNRTGSSGTGSGTGTGAGTGAGTGDDNGNNAANTAAALGAGAVGGYILADQLRKKDERKDDSGSGSGSTDTGSTYVAPGCSSAPSTPSCSSGSSCSGGSSCGGGGGCGGGGCGGG